MGNKPMVSLCIPTNGVIEWVFPVLESIYSQNVEEELFEVVITDNGTNSDFKEKINKFKDKHINLIYKETKALPFLNEIESYKQANGQLIKFVNHRTLLLDGVLNRLIEFSQKNSDNRPIVYFSNGVIKTLDEKVYTYNNFNDFVKNLSYWSSWSTGMTIWKEDFAKLPDNINSFNELFPHTTVLFNEINRGKYIIDNTPIMKEIPQGNKPKGSYDLFGAFGIEYISIILDLLRKGSITADTFKFVKEKNLEFITNLYFKYSIKKEYCSYDLSGLYRMFGIFYTKRDLYRVLFYCFLNKVKQKCFKRLKLN